MAIPFHPTTSESDFRRFREIQALYVDKTPFIRDIINNTETSIVILRPRRFGKTLNLSTLKYFFSNKETEANRKLFTGLSITQDQKSMMHFGKYPIIYLTLKDVKESNYEDFLIAMLGKISALFDQFPELANTPLLTDAKKEIFLQIRNKKANEIDLKNSLFTLSFCLEKHYGQKVVILLDEYDSPINHAYTVENNYYNACMSFMRVFLGTAFKENTAMFKGVITGILQVGKESIFSDANNLQIYSMLNDSYYAAYFGLLEEEVENLVRLHDVLSLEELRRWYNSYEIRGLHLYNPFSVMNAFHNKECAPYWMNSSSNDLIKKVIANSDGSVKEDIATLLQEGTFQKHVNSKVIVSELHKPDMLWGLFVSAGYLSASDRTLDENGEALYRLRIPNQEVKIMYDRIVNTWFTENNASYYTVFLEAITEGKPDILEEAINIYLQESVSFFEINEKTPESTYTIFMLGIVAGLKNQYVISNNVEVGYGRCDMLLSPKDKTKSGIIIEFKRCKDGNFEASQQEAFAQIESKQYTTKLRAENVSSIKQYAISFFKQQAKVAMK